MQQSRASRNNTFPIEINLVIFGHNEGKKAKVYFLKDQFGNFVIPQKKLSHGTGCYDTTLELLNECLTLDRTLPFNIELCGCVENPSKEAEESSHLVRLVFKLDLDISDCRLFKDFHPLSVEQIFDHIERGDISKECSSVFIMALFGSDYDTAEIQHHTKNKSNEQKQ